MRLKILLALFAVILVAALNQYRVELGLVLSPPAIQPETKKAPKR